MAVSFSMGTQNTNRLIIIGGSVAGLVAANRLIERGLVPLVIEGGTYPAFRVCGEFLSPECLPYLAKWDIFPYKKLKTCKFLGRDLLNFSLNPAAGGMSRSQLEVSLLQRFQNYGGAVLTNTKVVKINPPKTGSGSFYLELSSGIELKSKMLIVSTGRLFSKNKPFLPYIGTKAHYRNIDISDCLEMFLFKGGYCGISPIGPNLINVAMLSKNQKTLPKLVLNRLSNGELLEPGWVSASAPEFGVKPHPGWPSTFLVGDAAATIPPITGEGLGMAVTSGFMAADFALDGDAKGYQKAWRQRYLTRIKWGKRLHLAAINPVFSSTFMEICCYFPFLSRKLYSLTRESVKN